MDLESLSDDLLLIIMEILSLPQPDFPHQRHRNDLLPFIRCSRRLYQLGEPILYQNLIQKRAKTLPRFIKTVVAHPSLADHVRVVKLNDRGHSTPGDPATTTGQLTDVTPRQASDPDPFTTTTPAKGQSLNDEELDTIMGVILSLKVDSVNLWMANIRDGSWDAHAALLLVLLPNVEDLQIDNCQDRRWQRLGPTRNLLSYPFPFAANVNSNLRNLSISYQTRSCTEGLTAVPFRLLALPSLRSFSGDMMREGAWENPTDTKFSIRTLWLDRCNFSPNSLENLINSCPQLEVLKYEHDDKERYFPFHPRQFDPALANLKDSLKELILYRTALQSGTMKTSAQFCIIKSLKEFEVLTSLSITAQLLLGPQGWEASRYHDAAVQAQQSAEVQSLDSCLPPSLEHLKL